MPREEEYPFYGTGVWFATEDLISGEWEAIKSPPDEVEDLFREIPGNENVQPPADDAAIE